LANNPTRTQDEIPMEVELRDDLATEADGRAAREKTVARLRLLWDQRHFLLRVTAAGLVTAALVAFLIPKRYTATTRLMPPDNQSGSGLAMLAALSGKVGSSVGSLAGNFLGMKTSGALFIGVLQSRTVQDDLINKFTLRKVYWDREWEDARKDLTNNTDIGEDRKSGIITVNVTDRSPERAAAMAQEYVAQLNLVVSQLNTSSAHRERAFLEERLREVKQNLEQSEREFSQFASKNTTIDIKEQGKAMVEAAATLEGQVIAAQSELEGLRQIYTGNNVRVRAAEARINELERQLKKLGGVGDSAALGTSQESDSMYPSIRKLPLLGVAYADLYRQTRVNEVVFETLTQEYELAKVEEVKDVPSVKVLDPAEVPEKKSFPPRILIMILGTLLAFTSGVAWLIGSARWEEIDPQEPGKVFAQEMLTAIKPALSWAVRNGSGAIESGGGFFRRVLRRKKPSGIAN
jgi:uncharacterized protein involved in exopolysaccharide biosynthesis